jgi:hypothetical protein
MSMNDEPSYLAFARASVRRNESVSGTIARELVARIDRDTSALKAAQPRTITTVEELDALAPGSVILDPAGLSLHKNEFTGWRASNGAKNITAEMLQNEALPAIVLHSPAAA